MSDPFSPSAGGPPPFPAPPFPPHPATPAQPAHAQPPHGHPPQGHPVYGQPPHAPPVHGHAGSGGPPLQVAFPQQRQGASLYAPPPELDADEQPAARRGGSQWALWAVPVLAVVVIGAGAVVFLAARSGPTSAAAATAPPIWTQPLPPLPAIPPNWQGGSPRSDGGAAPVTPDASAPRRGAGGAWGAGGAADAGGETRPLVPLPPAGDIDRNLKQMGDLAELNGARTRAVKTLKSGRTGGVLKQPIELHLTATFPQVVAYLQRLHESLPHAPPVAVEMSHAPQSPLDAPRPLPVVMTVDIHYDPELGTSDAAGLPAPPALAPALVQMAKAAGNRLAFVGLSVSTTPSEQAIAYNLPTVTVEALATGDADVSRFREMLNRSDRLADVNLIVSEEFNFGGRLFHRCKIEFRITDAPRGAPPALNPAVALPPDVFRFPAALQQHAKAAPQPPGAGGAPKASAGPGAADSQHDDATAKRDAAVNDARKLRLQKVIGGKVKLCTINGDLYRAGDEVGGFTIEEITPSAVTVARGEYKFELRLAE